MWIKSVCMDKHLFAFLPHDVTVLHRNKGSCVTNCNSLLLTTVLKRTRKGTTSDVMCYELFRKRRI